jgi:hypothetical protein
VTGEYDTAPDIEVLCNGIEAGIDELFPTVPRRRLTTRKEKGIKA